jgi:hypothetical protein
VRLRSMMVFFAFLVACSSSEALPKAPPAPKKLVLLPAPAGEVATVVAREATRVQREGGQLLVYVGATWCEPCQEFHKAAEAGQLDTVFPGLTLVVFDADADGPRLAAAGYRSNLVPLFVRPAPDGSSSQRQTEGVHRGSDAVADLTPRLKELLR